MMSHLDVSLRRAEQICDVGEEGFPVLKEFRDGEDSGFGVEGAGLAEVDEQLINMAGADSAHLDGRELCFFNDPKPEIVPGWRHHEAKWCAGAASKHVVD